MNKDYPKKIRIVVYLTHGEPINSAPITFRNENDEASWASALRDMKNMKHIAVMQTNALGDTDTIFVNPNHITAVRVINVQE